MDNMYRFAPPPTLSTKAQWTLLHHYLNQVPLREFRTSNQTWLGSIDGRLLLTALVKKSAELELLLSEAKHVELAGDIEFPDYDAAFATPMIQSLSIEGFPISDLRTPVSPGSPTFGPRQGACFLGTVSRRRSLGPPPELEDELDVGKYEESKAWKEVSRDWERRLQWQAAWHWIERHLDYYAHKFYARDFKHSERSRKEVWEELVKAREECERLQEKVKRGKEAGRMVDVDMVAY